VLLRKQAVAKQWLSTDHVVTPTDTNAITEDVFYSVRPEVIRYRVGAISQFESRVEASRRRRRKGNPVPGGITGSPCSWGI
jgi:hypothetical protein